MRGDDFTITVEVDSHHGTTRVVIEASAPSGTIERQVVIERLVVVAAEAAGLGPQDECLASLAASVADLRRGLDAAHDTILSHGARMREAHEQEVYIDKKTDDLSQRVDALEGEDAPRIVLKGEGDTALEQIPATWRALTNVENPRASQG